MSIVKMKRLRLVGLQSEQDRLLSQLQHLGCVEISQPAPLPDDPEWACFTRPDMGALAQAAPAHKVGPARQHQGGGQQKAQRTARLPAIHQGQLLQGQLRPGDPHPFPVPLAAGAQGGNAGQGGGYVVAQIDGG